ncbi:nucleoside diphosphate kinase regulator [Mycobacterium tuberculosis CAS/NITR204]|uniref:Nucleoside diphosphate kinase regulator n=1 Tax=Mycobacterium tuberculosis CAS/NITR204 TaxID=1310114 RepID=R4MP72_MYCTX|nr:nucleoside diphosphate kinase regulator [Mycobacterium tuberculosis CAS/NITR204]
MRHAITSRLSWPGCGSDAIGWRSRSRTTGAFGIGDAAEAIQRPRTGHPRCRINELDRRLRTGPTPWSGSETLPGGTEVTLRFPDGEVVTMHVISVVEETPVGREAETLTARSPLGQALAGHQPGDTVTYSTPQGPNQVQLLAVKLPS